MPFQRYMHLISNLVAIIFSCAIAYAAVQNPLKNWDIVGYTATIIANKGLPADELHEETWDSLRKGLGDIKILQEGNEYMKKIAQSPEALEQQIPYYKPRIAYTFFASQLSKITKIDIPRATILTSALFICFLFLLVYFTLKNHFPAHFSLLITMTLAACLHWIPLSRMSTPDAMSAFFLFYTALLFRQKKNILFIAFCCLLLLVRHDQIFVIIFLTIFHPCLEKWGKTLSISLFFIIFSGIYFYSKWYGWPLLFMHTFFAPQAYPASYYAPIHDVFIQYIKQWVSVFLSITRDTQTLLPIAAIIIAAIIRKKAIKNDCRLIDALSFAITIKIFIFPTISGLWARLYMGEIVSIIVIAIILAINNSPANSGLESALPLKSQA